MKKQLLILFLTGGILCPLNTESYGFPLPGTYNDALSIVPVCVYNPQELSIAINGGPDKWGYREPAWFSDSVRNLPVWWQQALYGVAIIRGFSWAADYIKALSGLTDIQCYQGIMIAAGSYNDICPYI
ncbi:MAG: hypothetical protein NTX86_02525 [Candidatus Dependentiae bacterium]|nr:hypothetical protein [Candidatus Dependentiae bacterium]